MEETRRGNRVSGAEEEAGGVQTATEEIEYPDLLNGSESAAVGSSDNG